MKNASFGSQALLLNWLTRGCPSSKCSRIQQCAIIRILPLLLPWNFSDERRVPKGPIAEPDKMADHQKSRTTSETSDWSLRAIAMIPQRRGSEASSTSSSLSSPRQLLDPLFLINHLLFKTGEEILRHQKKSVVRSFLTAPCENASFCNQCVLKLL